MNNLQKGVGIKVDDPDAIADISDKLVSLTEKIDGKTWGSEIFPMSEWIDPKKEYTCNGKRVIGLEIVLCNSCGREVTYPVKGSIVVREKPIKLEYAIWSLTGLADVVWGKGDNLVEVKK